MTARACSVVSLALLSVPAEAGAVVRMLESDSRHVVIEIVPEPAEVTPLRVGSHDYVSIRIPDVPLLDRAGEPELPASAVRVAVPPGTVPRLRVREATWSPRLPGAVRPSPDRIGVRDPFGPNRVVEQETVEDERYRAAVVYPAEPFALSEVMGMRDLRVVDVLWFGARAEPFARSHRLLTRAVLEVTFEPERSRERRRSERAVVPSELWQRTYRGVANREASRAWARGGPGDAGSVGDFPWGGNDQYKVEVPATGLLEIPFVALEGFAPGVPVEQVSVYQRLFRLDLVDDPGTPAGGLFEELPVPSLVRDRNANGIFDPGDGILAWCRSTRDQWMTSGWEHEDRYDTRNFVFVKTDPLGGARMATRVGAAPSGLADSLSCTPSEVFREEDRRYTRYPADFGPGQEAFETEIYYWNDHRTPTGGSVGWSFSDPFIVTDLVPDSSATMLARICPTGRPLFHGKTNVCEFTVNDAMIDSLEFYNNDLYLVTGAVDPGAVLHTFPIAPGVLREDANTFGFRGWTYTGDGTVVEEQQTRFLFDWYRVTYPRRLIARNGHLLLDTSKGTAGEQRIRVSGFSADDVLLFDVSDPEAPVSVTLDPAQLVANGGAFDLRFAHDNAGGAGRYLAIREAVIQQPTVVSRVEPPTLLAGGAGTRYAVVTHDQFETSARELAAYRSTRYPGAVVALLSEVYDVFGNGRIQAEAIKAYTAYAYHRWTLPIEFLCLIGDASEDHRGVGSNADPDLLPTHSLWSAYEGSSEETDQYYAEVTRDGTGRFDDLSDLYVGRFCVNTNAEMEWNLERMRAYETEGLDELWRRKTLLLADDALSGDLGTGVGSGYSFRSNETGFCDRSRWFEQMLESHPVDALLPDLFCWSDFSHPCPDSCYGASNLNCEDTLGDVCGTWYDCRIYPYNVDNWRSEYNCQRAAVQAVVLPMLRDKLNDGVFIWNYQGHANKYFLAHEEVWRDDNIVRHDVDHMANEGKPFIFLGFACHLTEFDREDERVQGDCVSEKMMNVRQIDVQRPAGCVAAFGSSGYEFLGPNLDFNEYVFRAFFFPDLMEAEPSGQGLPDDGEPDAYVWTLGEATTRARLKFQERPQGDQFRAAARRFVLLGDPALSPDFGTPSIEVSVNGNRVEDPSSDFFAPADEFPGPMQVVMTAAEGRGVATMRIVDSQRGEIDPSEYEVTTDQQTSDGVPQVRTLTYEFQLRSGEAYSLSFEAVDGAGHAARFVLRTDTRFEFVDGEAAVFPNPFRSNTQLVFRLPSRALGGTIGVYTVSGRRILERSLGSFAPNEQIEVEWDGRDEGGLPVANGTYFMRLNISGASGSIDRSFPVVKMD